jgi:hypothetical protein
MTDETLAYIGDVKLSPEETKKRVKKVKEGADAPLTDMIYGIAPLARELDTDVLPQAQRDFQGEQNSLQRFMSMYEPGELVMRQNFRRHLLQILEDWRLKDVKK